MSENDFDVFAVLLDAAYALYGKALPAEAKAAYFESLKDWPMETVRAALNAHVRDAQRGQFAPKPADLIAQWEGYTAHDGRPEADEAWAIALAAQDEAATLVWTAEMMEAFGIARVVLDRGDQVGARMAFKDAYKRLVEAARKARRAVHWQTSLGWDAEQREVALTQAVARRRISASTAAALLPPPDRIDEGDGAHQVRANLQRIREQLAALPSPLQRARAARAARLREQRQTVRARKSGMLEQIWRYAYLYPDTFPVFPLLTYDQSVSARVRPECRCPMPVPAAQAKRKAA
ncbi:conserved hypothetical protein [Candidatus Glomeribacter gigasporarum BEG34]|uniref:Uncharacterized protein n=1 Tax=Candidatus Glomeribacter gigasporarum BEG34 TaxID=1070319 RepID=G2J7C6_9BURK|nr:hypothetical protein [Candidatus Glomeribacter gigasporarum]CCD28667.1 conserved hypothetical protein [Candidatus Glomeribacter gigasporarum BEG34]